MLLPTPMLRSIHSKRLTRSSMGSLTDGTPRSGGLLRLRMHRLPELFLGARPPLLGPGPHPRGELTVPRLLTPTAATVRRLAMCPICHPCPNGARDRSSNGYPMVLRSHFVLSLLAYCEQSAWSHGFRDALCLVLAAALKLGGICYGIAAQSLSPWGDVSHM